MTLGLSMGANWFILGIRVIVVALNLAPLYCVNYEILEWMPNEMDRFIYKVILNTFIFLALLSYFVASVRKLKEIP